MPKWWPLFFIGLLLALVSPAIAQDGSSLEGDPAFPAPAFPEGLDWLNVPAPVTLASLRGKVVLLDFWTYGCINCIHMIPTIQRLEEKYGPALAVIGVHSAKFLNEGQTESLRQIIKRYGLAHPVVNDRDFVVWDTYAPYGVGAWPTFVLIDPRGNLFAVQAGEVLFEDFDRVIGAMIEHFDSLGAINREPLVLQLEADAVLPSALAFPGKVLADPVGNRLFIADSSHNRLIIADLFSYDVLDVIGSGAAGLADGDFASASFRKPQGLSLRGDTLYVADTQNHVIRAVDLLARQVTTIAGTGVQGYERTRSGPALEMPLASPWDVWAAEDGTLYIAMAGTHQIWTLAADGTVAPLVGSGGEGLREGRFEIATLAQPSGLYLRGNLLYWADSESSSIRAADLVSRETRLLVGPLTGSLFDFGDLDGGLGTARLQHPLAVIGGDDGLLYIADTYNSKIKSLDPATNEVRTLYGAGSPGGFRDGDGSTALFDEPGGLSFAGGLLYVADTNNHAIRVINLATGVVRTVAFPNPELLQIGKQVTVIGGSRGEQIDLPTQSIRAGAGSLTLTISLPEGYKLNPNIDSGVQWTVDPLVIGVTTGAAEPLQTFRSLEELAPLPVMFSEGQTAISAEVTLYYCEAVNETLCFIDQSILRLPVTIGAEGESSAVIERRIVLSAG
jgi:thiol-disulfide isomerase/thioredoxin